MSCASRHYRLSISAVLTLGALGCGDSGSPNPPPPTITAKSVQIVSGEGQRGVAGNALATPLRVRVIGSDDQPLAGAIVGWSVTQGHATLDPPQSTTDANGEAETHVTLGSTAEAVAVTATVEELTPATFSLTALDSPTFVSESAGFQHTCALAATGDAYCWGAGADGPVLITGGLQYTQIAAGGPDTCGLTAEGTAYCWGAPLGDGTFDVPSPVPVSGDVQFASISASGGDAHHCALTPDGVAYCWGNNSWGELGDGTTVAQPSPVPVAGDLRFVALGTGNNTSCGLTGDGATYCWGSGLDGALGTGNIEQALSPVPVAGGLRFVSLAFNALTTCGMTSAGAAYCWGFNDAGELGIGRVDAPDQCEPGLYPCSLLPVPVAGGLSFAKLSSGTSNGHICGLTPAGAAYCWGSNTTGQLGTGAATTNDICYEGGPNHVPIDCQTVPAPVSGGLSFVQLSAGGGHTCGVTPDGAVYCWGYNRAGQLGSRSGDQSFTPVQVSFE